MTLQGAIDAPRMSITSTGSTISMEPGFPQATVDSLRTLGYTVSITRPGTRSAPSRQCSWMRDGQAIRRSGSRREGTVIGLPRPRN